MFKQTLFVLIVLRITSPEKCRSSACAAAGGGGNGVATRLADSSIGTAQVLRE